MDASRRGERLLFFVYALKYIHFALDYRQNALPFLRLLTGITHYDITSLKA